MEETGLIKIRKLNRKNCRKEFNIFNPGWVFTRDIRTKLTKIRRVDNTIPGEIHIIGENTRHEIFKLMFEDRYPRYRSMWKKLEDFAPELKNINRNEINLNPLLLKTLENLWIHGRFNREDKNVYKQSRLSHVFTDKKPVCIPR